MSKWQSPGGSAYAARFDRLAAQGVDVHGEASFVERLAPPAATVLDAGCGTGRVAISLSQRGFHVVGIDVDADMLAVARERSPHVTWTEADLADAIPGRYDVIVAAGNVLPLVDDPPTVIANLAAALAPQGFVVAGFGLDEAHLPLDEAPFTLAEYDAWCRVAGLTLVDRRATWEGAPYVDGPYAVSTSVGP